MVNTSCLSNPVTAAYHMSIPRYPTTSPYHPDTPYPEYKWGQIGATNMVYQGVRELLHLLNLDEDNYGSQVWNPLRGIVLPGDTVVLKPNFISHSHKNLPNEWEQVITHGSIIRAVLDYVLIALDGKGKVWITDGPQLDADWSKIIERTGVNKVVDYYSGRCSVPIHLLDLREKWLDVRGDIIYRRIPLDGDPAGSVVVNLDGYSRFINHTGIGRYYGADYDQNEVNIHHHNGCHEYKLSKSVISADVFINLPKIKTHKKVGVTLCLKNLVGINTGRNWLPHHTDGDPSNGGDQFPLATIFNNSERWGIKTFQNWTYKYPKIVAPIFRLLKIFATPIWGSTEEVIRNGNWHGTDTAWRMVHDINRCLLYSNDNSFPSNYSKRYFAIADGVIAGEGNGPASPDIVRAGMLVAGFNPVAVDCVITRLMGFNPKKIKVLNEAFEYSRLPLTDFIYSDINISSNKPEWNLQLEELLAENCYRFKPHFGWMGQIEYL